MKKIILLFGVLILSGCATSTITSISKLTSDDIHDTVLINQLSNDTIGLQCTAWAALVRPQIHEVLIAKVSGPLSVIAKKRAINLLYIKLTPQFEQNCGPVLIDEGRWFLKLFSPLG